MTVITNCDGYSHRKNMQSKQLPTPNLIKLKL